MLWLAIGLAGFLGLHSVRIVAPGWRERRIARMGEKPWKGLYSLLSLACFVLIVWGFGQARQQPVLLWQPPVRLRHASSAVLAVAFGGLLVAGRRLRAAQRHPCPRAASHAAGHHGLVDRTPVAVRLAALDGAVRCVPAVGIGGFRQCPRPARPSSRQRTAVPAGDQRHHPDRPDRLCGVRAVAAFAADRACAILNTTGLPLVYRAESCCNLPTSDRALDAIAVSHGFSPNRHAYSPWISRIPLSCRLPRSRRTRRTRRRAAT